MVAFVAVTEAPGWKPVPMIVKVTGLPVNTVDGFADVIVGADFTVTLVVPTPVSGLVIVRTEEPPAGFVPRKFAIVIWVLELNVTVPIVALVAETVRPLWNPDPVIVRVEFTRAVTGDGEALMLVTAGSGFSV